MRLAPLARILAAFATLSAGVGVAACRHPTAGGSVPDEEPTQPSSATTQSAPAESDAGTDQTCLGKAHLAFDNVACNTCMSDNAACCAATIACFGGDSDCAELHACMTNCGGAGDAGGGGRTATGTGGGMGNGTGGGDGGGTGNGEGGGAMGNGGDGGTNSCQDACKIEHQRAVDKWTTYNACTIVTCKAQCL